MPPFSFKVNILVLFRFSKGKRSNLRGSSVKPLIFISEEETASEVSTSDANATTQPKRTTRKTKQQQQKSEVAEDVSLSPDGSSAAAAVMVNKKPEQVMIEMDENKALNNAEDQPDYTSGVVASICPADQSESKITSSAVVSISTAERLSAEQAQNPEVSPGRTASKIAIAGPTRSSRRSSVRCSLKVRYSLAGLRHSMTQESVRRASRRSMLKRKVSRMTNSTCSDNNDGEK